MQVCSQILFISSDSMSFKIKKKKTLNFHLVLINNDQISEAVYKLCINRKHFYSNLKSFQDKEDIDATLGFFKNNSKKYFLCTKINGRHGGHSSIIDLFYFLNSLQLNRFLLPSLTGD